MFERLELVALSCNGPPMQHCIVDQAAATLRTFAYLVFKLPSGCHAGAIVIDACDSTQAKERTHSEFAAVYAAAFCDCPCTLEVAEDRGHAVFVVFAVRLLKVRTSSLMASLLHRSVGDCCELVKLCKSAATHASRCSRTRHTCKGQSTRAGQCSTFAGVRAAANGCVCRQQRLYSTLGSAESVRYRRRSSGCATAIRAAERPHTQPCPRRVANRQVRGIDQARSVCACAFAPARTSLWFQSWSTHLVRHPA